MGFSLTIFYMFIIYLRPQEFIPAIKGFPLVDVVSALCMAAVFLEGNFTSEKFKRSPVNYLVVFFWMATVLSNMASFYLGGAIHAFVKVGSNAVFAYYLVVLTVDNFKRLKLFIWIMLLLCLLQAMQAILQYYTGVGLVGGETLARRDLSGDTDFIMQAQGIGIFADPNDLALSIVIFLPFFLPYIHKPFLSRTMLSGALLMLPAVTGLIFTRSRGGVLGLGFVFWFYFYRRVGALVSIGFLVALASILLTLPRMGSISKEDGAVTGRMEHWSYGMELFKAHPLFGAGMDRFTDDYPQTAHNSFILVLSECGFLGAFMWLTMFIAAMRDIYLMRQIPRAPPWLNGLLDGLLSCILTWQVSAFFLSQTYKFLSFVLLGMVVATMTCLSRLGLEVDNSWSSRWTFLSLAATVVAAVGMYVLVRLLWAIQF